MRKPQALVRGRNLHTDLDARVEPRPVAESRTPGMVEVRAGQADDGAQALADAVLAVGGAADRNGIGIMITDVGGGNFVVRAHPAVPHGLVREQLG